VGANWPDPDPLAVRLALVGLMFASVLMSVASATPSVIVPGCLSAATCSSRSADACF